ncbi:MAG: outer membrane beta-barrel protein [Pseudomonadota bacterium]
MIRDILISIASIGLLAGTAAAQEWNQFHGPYVIGEIGYENGEGGFDQFIGGGAVGANYTISEKIFVGGDVELLGSADGAVDFTWGIHGQIGYIVQERHAVFARAGYREFNFDSPGGSDGDYALGVGSQFELSDNWSVRTLLDTVAFDTIGVRGGLVFHF